MLLIAACNSSSSDGTVGTSPEGKPVVLGYYTGDSASMASATSTSTPVNAVSMDVIAVNPDGSLSGTLPASLLTSDTAQGKVSYAVISNFGATDFDPALGHDAMVTNEATTIKNIVSLAATPGLAGINIDFEGIYDTDRDAYTTFVADLAAALHAAGSTLVLSVPAKSADDPNDTWSWPYDYASLAQYADLFQVMTYDENVPGEPPGPVAGADWMKACLQYAAGQIPTSKILMALPAYGYDYDATAGTGVSVAWKDVPALLSSTGATPQWDAATSSPFIDYTDQNGDSHQVWYEDTQSIQLKSAYAVSLGLKGVSMWALGLEDADFWSAVEAGLD
jgi:spore germination protein